MRPHLLSLLALPALITLPLGAQQSSQQRAQQSDTFDFSIQNIMRGPELYGRAPERVRWTPDGRWIYFVWLEAGTDWRERPKPYRVRAAAGAKPERMTDAHMDSVGPLLEDGSDSRDGRLRAVTYQGDVYLVDRRRATARRLTETKAVESRAVLAADARRVFFVRDGNAWSIDVAGGGVRQLTDIRTGPAPEPEKPREGQRGALELEQRELLEVVRDRLQRDSLEKAQQAARDSQRVKPLYLAKGERVATLAVSPSGKAVLVATVIPAGDKERDAKVPNYVTTSGYTEELDARSKVGDAQDLGRMAFMSLPSGEARWIGVVPDDSTYRANDMEIVGWNEAGDAALVFALNKSYKKGYIRKVDAGGALSTIDERTDSAWVDGPCTSCAGWYDGGRRVWFVSEADGWAHLYTAAADGSDRRQLTQGKWEVLDAELSPDRRDFLLHTSEVSPFEQHVYRMRVAGGARTRLTTRPGGHAAVFSPDGARIADVFSYANRPPELYLAAARAGAEQAQLTTSTTADWRSFPWIVPEIVMIPASDGVQVPARIYRPQDVGAQPNGAGVIFVHGAGYLHNVHNWWSSYAREYMFNQYLASKGYVVLDIDYRGSAGYGRDWRTAIYRHMGGRDLQDQVDGSHYLQKTFGIAPERVGLYGGSYGGFITLMALFTEPKSFGAGAALRSVTDWAHYNHGYTARILNQPQDDTLAYKRSSPIYFAEGLEDPLLIAHGMVDVNVHFQDVVRLSQRLIELGKTGWEMAVYPVEDHGFVRPSSWADEYRRIYELFERHLPARTATSGVTGGR